ncbi:MAG TPA: recombinase family protein, partial [Actinoplanes sp.]
MNGSRVGYARCSTDEQDVIVQTEQLTALGIAPDRIYIDRGFSGTSRKNRAGRLFRQTLAAEFEANLIRLRTRGGMVAKQLRGKQPKLAESAQRSIRARYAEGGLSIADLAEEYRVGRSPFTASAAATPQRTADHAEADITCLPWPA